MVYYMYILLQALDFPIDYYKLRQIHYKLSWTFEQDYV